MKVTTERIPESQILLEIELDDERVTKSLNQAARRLSQRYRIPGFRKGKAPAWSSSRRSAPTPSSKRPSSA